MSWSLYLRGGGNAYPMSTAASLFAKIKELTAKESMLRRRSTVAAQNLIKSSLVSVTLRDTSGAVVMCTATNCSM